MGKKEDEHNRGQKDGSEATIFDYLAEDLNLLSSQEYKEGFRHGYANRPQKEWKLESPKHEKPKEEKSEQRPEPTVETSFYDDDYYDDDGWNDYEPPPPAPPPPKITHDSVHYSVSDSGFTKTVTTYEFKTEEEKEEFLAQRRRLKAEFFREHPELLESELIEEGKQRRIRDDIEAFESGNPVEIFKLFLRKAILG